MEPYTPDDKDQAILQLLRDNARLTYSQLGEAVGLSRTAVKNRVGALERTGIIRGYRAVVDATAPKGYVTFIINVETRPESFDEVRDRFAAAPETILLLQTSGNCHLTALCAAGDVPAMRTFVNGMYRQLPGIASINAHAVLDRIKGRILPD